MNNILEWIASRLIDIDIEDMSEAEVQIAKRLEKEGFLHTHFPHGRGEYETYQLLEPSFIGDGPKKEVLAKKSTEAYIDEQIADLVNDIRNAAVGDNLGNLRRD